MMFLSYSTHLPLTSDSHQVCRLGSAQVVPFAVIDWYGEAARCFSKHKQGDRWSPKNDPLRFPARTVTANSHFNSTTLQFHFTLYEMHSSAVLQKT